MVKARYSVPVQTGPRAHTVSITMTTGSFPGSIAAGAWRSAADTRLRPHGQQDRPSFTCNVLKPAYILLQNISISYKLAVPIDTFCCYELGNYIGTLFF